MKRSRCEIVCIVVGITVALAAWGGCAGDALRTHPQSIEAYRQRAHRTACRLVSCNYPTATSALLTFQRVEPGSGVPIMVRLVWRLDPEPIETDRGSMLEISVSEGGRTGIISQETIRSVEALRTIEDIWPEYTELSSPHPGSYDLLLSNGVPAGINATLVVFRRCSFAAAVDLTSKYHGSGVRMNRPKSP